MPSKHTLLTYPSFPIIRYPPYPPVTQSLSTIYLETYTASSCCLSPSGYNVVCWALVNDDIQARANSQRLTWGLRFIATNLRSSVYPQRMWAVGCDKDSLEEVNRMETSLRNTGTPTYRDKDLSCVLHIRTPFPNGGA